MEVSIHRSTDSTLLESTISAPQLARERGVSAYVVRAAIDAGELPAWRVGSGWWRIPRSAARSWPRTARELDVRACR